MTIKVMKYWCLLGLFYLLVVCTPCYVGSEEKVTENVAGKTRQYKKCQITKTLTSVHIVARYTKVTLRYNVLIFRKLYCLAALWS